MNRLISFISILKLKTMNTKSLLCLLFAFAMQLSIFGQTDKEFWFAAPRYTISHIGSQRDSI